LMSHSLQHTATHCNTLQHTATQLACSKSSLSSYHTWVIHVTLQLASCVHCVLQ